MEQHDLLSVIGILAVRQNDAVVGLPLDGELFVRFASSNLGGEKGWELLPVLIAAQQHHHFHVVVPDHLPIVGNRVSQRVLSEDILAQASESLNKRRVDVIATLLAGLGSDVHSEVLDWQEVQRAILGFIAVFESGDDVEVFRFEHGDEFELSFEQRQSSVGRGLSQRLREAWQLTGRDLGGRPAFNGFQQRVMNEHVLFLGLNQVIALSTDMFQETVDINAVLLTHHPQHGVDDDVRSRTTNTCGAVHYNGACSGRICGRGSHDERQHRQRVIRYTCKIE